MFSSITRSKIDKLVAVFIVIGMVMMSLFLPNLRGVTATLFSPEPTGSPLPTPTPTPLPTLSITGVDPTHGSTRTPNLITITGTQFLPASVVTLGDTRLAADFVSSTELQAIVPAGMAPGVYTLRVCNLAVQCVEIADVYTVEAIWPPVLLDISPITGPSNMPNDVTIFGRAMQPGIQISIGNTLLQTVTWVNPMIVQAVVPGGLATGIYTITARNPSTTEPSILQSAYTVFDPQSNADDFFAGPDDLWTFPYSIHEGDVVQLGLVVHRNGGTTSKDVKVSFYNGVPSPQTLISTTVITSFLPGTGNLGVGYIDWDTTGYSSTVEMYARIDPDNAITETNKLNNVTKRKISIIPAFRDTIPPHIARMSINDGAQITRDSDVTITLVATDTGGSGLQSMYLIDRMYNASAHQWVAVQQTGWLPYQQTFTMTLSDRGGVHYIQAWVADGMGNISLNFTMKRINYLRQGDHTRQGDINMYQLEMVKDQTFTAVLHTLSGDSDLYVWGPGGNNYWSMNSGTISDVVSFTAPVTGFYAIEVYGYWDSIYSLDMTTGNATLRAPRALLSPSGSGKTQRTEPSALPDSTPVANAVVTDAPVLGFKTYIPMVQAPKEPTVFKTYLPIVGHYVGLTRRTYIPIGINSNNP